MDWELAIRRQAVTEWRDQQILAANMMLNTCAQAARSAFEAQLAEASVLDSAWDPAGFSNRRIDALLRKSVMDGVANCFARAGKELASIDARLAPLGEALGRGEGIDLPLASQPEAVPETIGGEMPIVTESPTGWLTRLRGTVSNKAGSLASYASETADWLVQDKVGLRDRLRSAAANRIATQWMGDMGDPPSVRAQMIATIDRVAQESRAALL